MACQKVTKPARMKTFQVNDCAKAQDKVSDKTGARRSKVIPEKTTIRTVQLWFIWYYLKLEAPTRIFGRIPPAGIL